MATFTVSTHRMTSALYSGTSTTSKILGMSNCFQMIWITAGWLPTEMV